ncbi:unnamed protein product, partial [Rotaria magnacalcarata]
MRPRGETRPFRKHSTPEKDPQEVEDLLLRSYEYTRCTKRVNKTPVTYDYTYSINTKEGPAGGGSGNYSIYFGPRKNLPVTDVPKEVENKGVEFYSKHPTAYEDDTKKRTPSVVNVTLSDKATLEDDDIYVDINPSIKPKIIEYIDLEREYPSREGSVDNEETRLKDREEDYRERTPSNTEIYHLRDDSHERDQNTSHNYSGSVHVSEKDERKESISALSSIEQQYENTIKALDTASDLKPEDKSYLNIRKEYLDKVRLSSAQKSSETKEHESSSSDTMEQYQDTVRKFSKEVLRTTSEDRYNVSSEVKRSDFDSTAHDVTR